MKNIIYTLATGLLAIAGCDFVDVPNQTGNTGGPGGNNVTRRVLVEEFTGHTCIACPNAARTLKALDSIYDDQLITIAIHAGWFAEPCPPHPLPNGAPAGSFSDDFRSDVGNDYDAIFNMSSSPPAGLVNRLGWPTDYNKSQGSWGGLVDSLLQVPASADLEIDHTYNTSSRALTLTVDGKFIDAQNGSFNVAVMIIEDSLVGWQIDGATYVPDYVFNHVLRACVNTPGSITGIQVATGAIAENSTFSWTLSNAYTVNSGFDASHCKLVAILYNTATMEVLQAAEEELVE